MGGWLAALRHSLPAPSSASPGSLWRSMAAAELVACRGCQAHAASQLNLPGHTQQSPQALPALVIWLSLIWKYAKQKLLVVQEGLGLLSREVNGI